MPTMLGLPSVSVPALSKTTASTWTIAWPELRSAARQESSQPELRTRLPPARPRIMAGCVSVLPHGSPLLRVPDGGSLKGQKLIAQLP